MDILRKKIACINCGQDIEYETYTRAKANNRSNWDKCRDCKTKQYNHINYIHALFGTIVCQPHHGKVNDRLQPLDPNGNLYKPGIRICGHRDCLLNKHIVEDTLMAIVEGVFRLCGVHLTIDQVQAIRIDNIK